MPAHRYNHTEYGEASHLESSAEPQGTAKCTGLVSIPSHGQSNDFLNTQIWILCFGIFKIKACHLRLKYCLRSTFYIIRKET